MGAVGESRREELLGAALGGDLTPEERAELEALLRDDPAARAELDAAAPLLQALAGARGSGLDGWVDAEPPESLRRRVLDPVPQPEGAGPGAGPAAVLALPHRPGRAGRRRVPALVAAASALLLAGAGGGVGLQRWLDRPPSGPAGTLGAHEPIAFTSVPDGVDVSATVVAHTWGTETVFEEVRGLEPGRTYEVVLVTADGAEVGAGSFEAVPGPVTCRMTSATLREEVAEVSVRTVDGAEVMTSPLPPVRTTASTASA